MSDKEDIHKKGKARETDDSSLKKSDPEIDSKVGELAAALDVSDPEEKKKLIASISRFTSSPVPPSKCTKRL